MEDKYLMYKINNFQFTNDPYNVFKSSHTMTQIMVDADQDGPENLLQGKEAHFDGLICYA